jgi:hypothetical protein
MLLTVSKLIGAVLSNGLQQVRIDGASFGEVIGKDSKIKPLKEVRKGNTIVRTFEYDGVKFNAVYEGMQKGSSFFMKLADAEERYAASSEVFNAEKDLPSLED